jgi:hypothetical protein
MPALAQTTVYSALWISSRAVCAANAVFYDDDARLSFLTGNYITLTNLTPARDTAHNRPAHQPINVFGSTQQTGLARSFSATRPERSAMCAMKQLEPGA